MIKRITMNIQIMFLMVMIFTIYADTSLIGGYDPLLVSEESHSQLQVFDRVVYDESRHRTIPIRIYLPVAKNPAPVVLFSHGLGGSREGNAFMGRHWSSRGYVVVFMQHPGSDDSIWKEKPIGERFLTLRGAANAKNFLARVKDIPAVLDQLERWNQDTKNAIFGRLDLKKVGMSGHSFGAITTQAVSGQTFGDGKISYTDSRIKAAIMFSPSSPHGGDLREAFSKVSIPWMLMTGTKDVSIIGNSDVASRIAVFEMLPPGNKYLLVLNGAEHSAFTDRYLPGDSGKRNPNHHIVILALSTAFWDAFLRGDKSAKAWLDGEGARSIIEKEDHWQIK